MRQRGELAIALALLLSFAAGSVFTYDFFASRCHTDSECQMFCLPWDNVCDGGPQ